MAERRILLADGVLRALDRARLTGAGVRQRRFGPLQRHPVTFLHTRRPGCVEGWPQLSVI